MPLILGVLMVITFALLLMKNPRNYSVYMGMFGGIMTLINGIWSWKTPVVEIDDLEIHFRTHLLYPNRFLLTDLRKFEFISRKKVEVNYKGVRKKVYFDMLSAEDREKLKAKMEELCAMNQK